MADNDMHNNGSDPNTNSPITRNPPDTHRFPPVMPPLPWETGQMDQSGQSGQGAAGMWQVPVTIPAVPEFSRTPGQYYGQVRFINASTYNLPVNIFIDETIYSSNSQFGGVSEYGWVADGFHTVTVRPASGPRTLLFDQTFPFPAGQMMTMVLTDSSSGGLDMVSISDTGCSNLPYNVSCFRFANMAYSGSAFDLLLSTGETVFNNIGFQTVSPYKQAVAGNYRFVVVNANTFPTARVLPIIIVGGTASVAAINQPLIPFDANLVAGQSFTAYVIGNSWSSDYPLQVIVVPDSVPSGLQPFAAAPQDITGII